MTNEITIREVYDLVDKKMGDLDKSLGSRIEKLSDAFMKLEEGRVSALEKQVAELTASYHPIRLIVYGMVGMILITVLGALLYLVIK